MKTIKPPDGQIRWFAINKYVDIDTGQQLRYKDATDRNKYIIIKTIKHVTINHNKSKGTIEYTRQCIRNPQKTIW